jgi:hypothetical protein
MNNFSSQYLLSFGFMSGILVGSSCIYFFFQIKIKKMENEIDELEKKNLNLLKQLMYFGFSTYDKDFNKHNFISYEKIFKQNVKYNKNNNNLNYNDN